MSKRIRGMRIAAQISLAAVLFYSRPATAQPSFHDDFSAGDARWEPYREPDRGAWTVQEGVFKRVASGRADTARLAPLSATVDAMIEARLRVGDSSRQTFGLLLRAGADGSALMLRYYDRFQALHLLAYEGGHAKYTGHVSRKMSFRKGDWYRMKAAVAGGVLLGKMWRDGTDEPQWQLRAPVTHMRGGRIGLAAHGDTQIEFSEVSIWTDPPLVRAELERDRLRRLRAVQDRLELHIVPSAFATQRNGKKTRLVSVVVTADGERVALNGKLVLEVGEHVHHADLRPPGWVRDDRAFRIPEPETEMTITVSVETEIGTKLSARAVIQPSRLRSWRYYVARCIDTLIARGTDRYGPEHSPMIMAVIDTLTLTSPKHPKLYDSLVRLEGRLHRRGERGSNLWYDQALLRCMYRLSELSGDGKYAAAADAYVDYFFSHCRKAGNGMPVWGSHIYWDCYAERPAGDQDGAGPHEILIYLPEWEHMQRISPHEVRKAIDGIWRWHVVDKATGMHNRHDDARKGHDFAFSGGSFTLALACMYKASGERHYLDKARLVAGWHWRHRDPATGLVADSPASGDRYDGQHCMTSVTGPFAAQLLRASEISGDPSFGEHAVAYIKAFDKYAWDERAGAYFGMLKLDGTPVPGGEVDRYGDPMLGQTAKDTSNYGAWAPTGHVDIWRTSIFAYEFPLISAQAAIYAFEQTADAELLRIAQRWAAAIDRELPPKTGRRWKSELEAAMPRALDGGTYAENYGRAISFFVHLYRATSKPTYLERAEDLAREAVTKLFENGLFKGHPAKPYYEATNGVGILLHALLELDAPDTDLGGSF